MTRRNRCRWEICPSVDDGFFARFVAGNGRKIVTTEVYTRKEKAIKAIRVVDANFGSDIHDLTVGRHA
jgi:uncharacterized protein YegP (UPF0339 family)